MRIYEYTFFGACDLFNPLIVSLVVELEHFMHIFFDQMMYNHTKHVQLLNIMKIKKTLLALSLCLYVGTAYAANFNPIETERLALKGDPKAQYELGYAYYNGEDLPENKAKGIEWLTKSAKQGDAKAQYALGVALYDENIEDSSKQPVVIEWLTKSANQNNADAQLQLGVIYSLDHGKPESYKKGLYYFELAAAQGNVDAQAASGVQYLSGFAGGKKDYVKAFNYFKAAADQGHIEAKAQMAYLYLIGFGVKKDEEKAVKLFTELSKKGSGFSTFYLGKVHEKGIVVPQSYQKALEYYMQVSDYSAAQNGIGNLYLNGWGVAKDNAKAFEWFLKSAEMDHPESQYEVSYMYYKGIGVNKDSAKAFYWAQRGAILGSAKAQYTLGHMYSYGDVVPQDDKKSFEWHLRAAEQGNVESEYAVGHAYSLGIGVPVDEDKAFAWMNRAYQHDSLDAEVKLGFMYYGGEGVAKNIDKAYELWASAEKKGHQGAGKVLRNMKAYVTGNK